MFGIWRFIPCPDPFIANGGFCQVFAGFLLPSSICPKPQSAQENLNIAYCLTAQHFCVCCNIVAQGSLGFRRQCLKTEDVSSTEQKADLHLGPPVGSNVRTHWWQFSLVFFGGRHNGLKSTRARTAHDGTASLLPLISLISKPMFQSYEIWIEIQRP